jgi:hypothetical protein
MPAPTYRGRRVAIASYVDLQPIQERSRRWVQRVVLECGHGGIVVAVSPNHRRSRPVKAAFCTLCPPRNPDDRHR